jgi:hypothetical protein
MKRIVILALIALAAASGDTQWDSIPNGQRYSLYRSVTLSSSAEAVTIQMPAGGGVNAYFKKAWVYTEFDCDVTLERNGTAATTTAATVRALNPGIVSPVAAAFVASNAGVGTVIATVKSYALGSVEFDLDGYQLRFGTADNLTLRLASGTGLARIFVLWGEK